MDTLRKGQLKDFGQLMYESHASSRNLYEVSHPQLDLLVELAKQQKGVLGSRLTGAGFGGAIISLVKAKHVDEFIRSMTKDYENATGQTPSILTGRPPGGVIVQETSSV
jgi:galactokinase